MKKNYLMLIAINALLLFSCSKEDDSLSTDGNKARLMFGTVLNDMISGDKSLKQVMEMPSCSENTPAFVEVVLSGPTNVGTMADPLVVTVNPTPGNFDGDTGAEYFTNESPELELEPGTYTLEFFAVYDGDPDLEESERIWVAPMNGGSMADYVNLALPMDFNLRAGMKKYLDVEVVCFDNRLVNEYGYSFFDIEGTRAYEFCFFANYCSEDERDYPAAYSVNIWLGTDNTGPVLYSNLQNSVRIIGAAAFAEPLCIPLPNLSQFDDDEDYLYYEITLLEWDDVYDYSETDPISGTLSRNDIESNFGEDNSIFYEHIRFGCEDPSGGDTPCPQGSVDTDGDGIPDECDSCPNIASGSDKDKDCLPDNEDPCPNDPEDKCTPPDECEVTACSKPETAWMWGDHTITRKDNDDLSLSGKWGWAEKYETNQPTSNFNLYAAAGNNDVRKGFLAGEIEVAVDGTSVTVTVNPEGGVALDKLDIYVNDQKPKKAAPGNFKFYGGKSDDDPCSNRSNVYSFRYSGDGSFWIMVYGEVCKN